MKIYFNKQVPASMNLERWVRPKVFCLVFVLLCLSNQVSLAESYVARVFDRQQTVLEREGDHLSGVALNETTLVYFAKVNGVEGLYRFDAETETTTLLSRLEPSTDRAQSLFWGRQGAVHNGLALLDINGQVYVTDGTVTGTRFLRDFGTRYCCGLSWDPRTSILRIKVINGLFYLETVARPTLWRPTLWRSDGTPEGTWAITEESSIVLAAQISNRAATLIFQEEENTDRDTYQTTVSHKLFQLNLNGSLSIIYDFGTSLSYNQKLKTWSKVVKNSKGTFFCDDDVWRISNEGIVSIIESKAGCNPYSLSVSGDRVFYIGSNSLLMSTSGHTGASKMEAPVNPLYGDYSDPQTAREGRDLAPVCSTENNTYYGGGDGSLIEIQNGKIRSYPGPSQHHYVFPILCEQSKVLFSQTMEEYLEPYPITYFFDIKDKSFSRVSNLYHYRHGTNSYLGAPFTNGVLMVRNSIGDLFGLGPLIPRNYRRGGGHLFKVVQVPNIESAIMLLLDDARE